nr:hypothetical protein [Tanacetum cinerariifolium]
MAALRYRDKHNKVGYLLKPTGSDDYHQVIDFLRASHIRYALTHNLIIFNSLVKQFWSTSMLRSPELGPPAIQATIDKTPYTITEDLVRSQLQLADDGGIDDLPIVEIYSGMDNLGYVTEGKLTFFKNMFSPQRRFLVHTILHCLSTKSGSWDQFGSPIVVALICLSDGSRFNWSSYIFKGMHGQSSDPNTASFSRSHETDVGPFTNVDDEPLDGSFYMSLPRSTQAPPAGQPSGETKLKDHKKLFKDVVGKLVKKVKSLEVQLRTKKRKMVVSDSDQEKGGKQDVDLDALHALANAAVTVDSNIPPGGASNTPAAGISVPTAVPTGALTAPAGSPSVPADVPPSVPPAGVPNKGKSPMVEEYIPVKARTFKQMQEDILGPVLEEPSSKRQKSTEAPIPTVPDVPQSPIVSSPPSSGTRRKSLGRKRLPKPKSTLQELDLDADAQIFIKIVSNEDSNDEAHPVWSALIGWEDLLKLYGLVVKYYENHPVAGAGLILWGDLQVLFDSHEGGKGSCVWQHQHLWEISSWRLYTLFNVYILETVSGEVLYMFADVSYPLSVKFMERILTHKLELDTDVVANDMTTAEQLI